MVAKARALSKRARARGQDKAHSRRVAGKKLVEDIRKSLGMNRQAFSRLTQFSERAIAKWEAGQPLSAPSRQRMLELNRLQQALSGVMKEEFVGPWLQAPNEAFGGLKPLEVIERGEIDRLWRMIYLLESGVPS
jgi:DNA-binding transcriptional regulator YiaG